MCRRRIATSLFFTAFVVIWASWASPALAATPVVSDLTDYIQELGGYFFTIPNANVTNEIFWEQASYKVTPASSPSNITTIVMTKYDKAAVYTVSGSGSSSQAVWSATGTANPASFNFCSATDYVVETVTLDLRNLQAVATKQPDTTGGGNNIFSVVLKMNSGYLIRQNTQTLPATCPPQTSYKPGTKQTQQDVNSYTIRFPLEAEANQFVSLVTNVIPTLNPPILIGTTPSQ